MIDLSQPGTLARINKALAAEGINATTLPLEIAAITASGSDAGGAA